MNLPETAKLPPIEKMTFSTKLAYGAGDVGGAVIGILLLSYLSPFFTDVAHLAPGLAGATQLIVRVWDACIDPFIGIWSDRGDIFGAKIKAKWGRRYPWMLFSAIPFGMLFVCQWLIPFPESNQWGMFWFYTLVSMLLGTFFTTYSLPYTALTAELTEDYNERTSLNSFRFTFSLGGSIVALLIARTVFQQVNDPAQQYLTIGIICAIISVLPIFYCVWGTQARAKLVNQYQSARIERTDPSPLMEQLRSVFTNRAFMCVVGIYLCSWFSLQLTAAIIPYFAVSCLGLPTADSPLIILAVQGTALVMLSVWNKISQRVGKKAVYFMGSGFWAIAQAGLFLLQPGQNVQLYALAILAGLGVSTAYLVPWSMLPDVIELDELETGQRREGLFYSFMAFLQKICLGVAVAVVLQSLEWTGYRHPTDLIPTPDQPPAVLLAIRLAIGPIPTISLLAGLVFAYFYPITRELHQQILLQLAERRRES
ncbi:MFS transporter [Chamaesiphon sp.]|uniref:MFS transporter n=1 Tax=Chamaesiphon sp. TaxID=2814140 RepID=UPI00359393CA